MSNLNENPEAWLQDYFQYEYCAECAGDAEHHTAIPLFGNWFARCNFPRGDDGRVHPVVAKYRWDL